MMFGPDVLLAAQTDAKKRWPEESCGVVVDGTYITLPNTVAVEERANSFALPADTWTKYNIQAVIHSHCAPQHRLAPSAADMAQQQATNVPWGIILTDGETTSELLWFGDHLLDAPLTGRTFIHGVTDCYSIIRSWFWQERKIKLPEFPRDDEWWSNGGDLYREGFAAAGFYQITADECAPGDVVLMSIPGSSKVPHHGAVILEHGLMLHHLPNRLSNRQPLGPWRRCITHWLRYGGDNDGNK